MPAGTNAAPRAGLAARRARLAGALGVALLLCGACGQRPGVILDAGPDAAAWPPPPDRPRVRYLGELSTAADLKPGRSFFESVGRTLFGHDEPPGMTGPIGLCTDGADRLFVADPGARVVHVFDLDARTYARWQPPEDVDRFLYPVDVAHDPAGRLLVSDSLAGVVFVFDDEGAFLGTLGDDRLERPVGLALDADANVYVADAGAHHVVKLAPDDQLLATIGRRGSEPGEFNFPTYVAVDADGRLYVSDSLNFRVQVFDDGGGRPLVIGEKGDMAGYFAQPKGIAVDDHDRLLVVDAHFEAVQIFDDAGAILMTFGREGHGPGEFWLPAGVHADPNGRIYVADSYNRRVQVFEMIPEENDR